MNRWSRVRELARRDAFSLALASWAVPGSGYLLIGERRRGWAVLVSVGLCFWFGVFIGGASSVIDLNGKQLWYIAQIFCGLHLLAGDVLGRSSGVAAMGGKVVELGLTYTAVAGLLNLIAIVETLGLAFPAEPAQGVGAGVGGAQSAEGSVGQSGAAGSGGVR